MQRATWLVLEAFDLSLPRAGKRYRENDFDMWSRTAVDRSMITHDGNLNFSRASTDSVTLGDARQSMRQRWYTFVETRPRNTRIQ